MAIVEDHQVGDKVVVLDDLELVVTHIVLNDVGTEIGPLRKLVETLALVLRRVDCLPEFVVADVFQQEAGSYNTPQFTEGVVELVLAAGGAKSAQDG